jgi:anthranilate synthase/aminodeoxychorismate synthase-like glutamine amidotransferase
VKPYLLIDNYDSFTYNLVHSLAELGDLFEVWRNDSFELEDLKNFKPQKIMISPGPGKPKDSGMLMEVVHYAVENKIPTLGICLGHQALGEYFGAHLQKAQKVVHGKSSIIRHNGSGLFEGFAEELEVGRYHSLALEKESLPDCLELTAQTVDDAEVMGIKHKTLPMQGLQFHPESILSPEGKSLLKAFFV